MLAFKLVYAKIRCIGDEVVVGGLPLRVGDPYGYDGLLLLFSCTGQKCWNVFKKELHQRRIKLN